MTGTTRTALLATATVFVPLLTCNIVAGELFTWDQEEKNPTR